MPISLIIFSLFKFIFYFYLFIFLYLYLYCLFISFIFMFMFFIYIHGIHMYFPILTVFENGRFTGLKIDDILVKNVYFNLNFQNESHSFANCLFYILIISRKFPALQFLTRGIHMYFPILTGVKNGRFTS